MFWWEVVFDDGESAVYRYVKAGCLTEAVAKIPQQNWNQSVVFAICVQMILEVKPGMDADLDWDSDATATHRTTTAEVSPAREFLSAEPATRLQVAFRRANRTLDKVRLAARERQAYHLVSELIADHEEICVPDSEGLQLSLGRYLASPGAPYKRAVLASICDSEFELTLPRVQRTLVELLVSTEIGRYAAMALASAGPSAVAYLRSALEHLSVEGRDRIVSLLEFLEINMASPTGTTRG